MATTIADICRRTYDQIAPARTEADAGLYLTEIERWIPDACEVLATKAIDGENPFRQYLTKSYTLTVSSNTWSLTGATDIRLESIPQATVTHADSTYPLVYVCDPADLYWPVPGDNQLIHYTVEREVIRTRDATGTVDAMTGNLTIRNAVYAPIVAASAGSTTLPEQLEDALIEVLVGMAKTKLSSHQLRSNKNAQ